MYSYIFELINENLFPKTEYKSINIIESSEVFIKSLFENYKSSYKDIHLELAHFRQIIYGLASTKKNSDELVNSIKSFLSKNYLRHEIVEFIEQLKSEKQIVDILQEKYTGLNSLYVKVSDWQKIIYSDFKVNPTSTAAAAVKPKPANDIQLTLSAIKNHLDNFYYGSEYIKEEISRIFYEHNFKINGLKVLPKRNVMIVGPSGCGKTYIINKISKFLNLPFLSYDVTKMSRTGFVGDKVEDILAWIYKIAGSIEKMKNGVVFLDEVDKLASNLQYDANEISSIGVQYDLLKFIEGTVYKFSPEGHRDYDRKSGTLELDSSDLLIICGGAFTGIENIIHQKVNYNFYGDFNVMNYRKIDTTHIAVDDLVEYGFIKEFAARFAVILPMPERSMNDLYNILVNAEDSVLKNYMQYFSLNNCNLSLEDDALWQIAGFAYERGTGARGLLQILEKVLPMYSVANKQMTEFKLTKDFVKEKLNINS